MTHKPYIVGLGGSLRQPSRSLTALKETLGMAESHGAETVLLDLRALDLPMFVPTIPPEDYPPQCQRAILRLLDEVRRADGMIWSSPTYHGTVSGVFKNALDFYELLADDHHPYLTGKAIGLISINDSTTHAAMMNSVHELRAWLAPTQVTLHEHDFTPEFALDSERGKRRLARLAADVVEFGHRMGAESHSPAGT
jgi:FMN reductase